MCQKGCFDLHPTYTIPLMGCFLLIAGRIADKAVALLRLVPNLRSIPEDTAAEDIMQNL